MLTLKQGDQLTLSDNEKYLFLNEIPLDEATYYAFQKESDESFRIGKLTEDDKIVFIEDRHVIERIQKYLAELPEE
ncbi:MAG: hypothetical protein J6Y87_01440 [Muribaculaceae bacterium]|nr:hypothetical protein [Muribaculaceae bacterium]